MIRCITVIVSLSLLAHCLGPALAQPAAEPREFYELRIYRIFDYEKQEAMETFLRDAYLPALERLGIKRVGVFRNLKDENDHALYVLIPFSNAAQFSGLSDALQKDEVYQLAQVAFSSVPLEEPIYQRIESRLLKAFAGIPQMELAEYSKNLTPRIFELRLYQSHTDDHARRKVKMFNDGELQLMRDVQMAPVFFGETLIGSDVPNLVYMLSAENEAAHQQHWEAFLQDPRWNAMKDLPEFKDTVSKIESWYLKPVDFSRF